jgi:hypothetical protein
VRGCQIRCRSFGAHSRNGASAGLVAIASLAAAASPGALATVPAPAAIVTPAAGTAAGTAIRTGACRQSFDPLAAPPALLHRCGLPTYPARAQPVLALAVAGASGTYSYDLAGSRLTYRLPPRNFEPLHAPRAQLSEYGVPAPPAGGPALADWRHQMAILHFVPAPAFMVQVPAHASSSVPDFSDHWAGYVAYGGPFTRAAGTWVEPVLYRSHCRTSSLTVWAGIGGYASASLAQDGTAENTPQIGQNQAWWELTPAGMVPVPLYATVGAPFTAEVRYLGQGRFSFFMENDKTGAAWSAVEKSGNRASLGTAEDIVERPCLSGCTGDNATYANLSNFRDLLFKSARVDGTALGRISNYAESMSDAGVPYGPDLAQPGPFTGSWSSFDVRQRSCS